MIIFQKRKHKWPINMQKIIVTSLCVKTINKNHSDILFIATKLTKIKNLIPSVGQGYGKTGIFRLLEKMSFGTL